MFIVDREGLVPLGVRGRSRRLLAVARTGVLLALLATPGCAPAIRSRGSGPDIVTRLTRIDRTRHLVSYRVADSVHVAVFSVDSLGRARIALGRGGESAVETRLYTPEVVRPGAPAPSSDESRCEYRTSPGAAPTAAEATGGARLPMTVVCTSAPSGSRGSPGRWNPSGRPYPVLIVAALSPLAADSAATALQMWHRGAPVDSIARVLAPRARWSAAAYGR
jgi:hypothetical protein